MTSADTGFAEICLAIGVGLVMHSFGWGLITFALSVLVIEAIVIYWNQND